MKFDRRLIINYKDLYGTEKIVNQSTIAAVDRNTWAHVLARLNHLTRTRKDYPIIDVLKDWLGSENKSYTNELLNKIDEVYKLSSDHPSKPVIINLWTNFHLLDRILSVPTGESKFDIAPSKRELLEIYMTVNGEFSEKTSGIFDSVSEEDYPNIVDRLSRVLLTSMIPYHDIHDFKETNQLLIGVTIKSHFLFSFLEKEHSELLRLFLKVYEVGSWREYLRHMLPIAIHGLIYTDDSGLNYITIEKSANSEHKEQARRVLDHLSFVDETGYKIKTDFLNIRSNPLFRINDDTYLVLDTVLAINRIYNSIFFELLRLAEKNKQLHKAYSDFFSLYTYDFIEKYLSYQIIEKIFARTDYYRISGADIVSRFGIQTEPDYYVRNGHKVFLFEIKGSMLRGDAKQSFHYPTVEKEIKEKYLYNTEDKENKAIIQLIERTRILFEGAAIYDPNCRSNKVRVYPILLVSEIALTTPGINVIMNQWFVEELEKIDILRNNRHRIADLVVIDLDSLIMYSEHFEQRKGLFEETLNSYYAAIDQKKIKSKYGITIDEALSEKQIIRSYRSFSDFLPDYIKSSTSYPFRNFYNDIFNYSD